MSATASYIPYTLLSHDINPRWKVVRYPFTNATGLTIADMKPGYVIKFNTNHDRVLGAVAADDATLDGIIVDLPDPADDPTMPTVAVALEGSFNKNRICYANGAYPLSNAAITRLMSRNLYLDPTVRGPALPPEGPPPNEG